MYKPSPRNRAIKLLKTAYTQQIGKVNAILLAIHKKQGPEQNA
jgi:hypothetical protein